MIWIVAADERDGADGRELAERQLEAEREQQQRDAELGQLLDVVDVADRRPAGERTDDDAGEDVADDQRLAEALRQEAAGEGGEQHEREIGDEVQYDMQRIRWLAGRQPSMDGRRAAGVR